MIQAKWATVLWGSFPDIVRTISSIESGMKLDYERTEDSEGKPPTQAVRRGLQTLTVKYNAMSSYNAWPKGEIDMWTVCIGSGSHAPFYVVGGESFFGREFICVDVNMTSDFVNIDGHMLYGELTVKFEEFALEPSGLKVDKGFDISFQQGDSGYNQQDYEGALRARASNNDKLLTLKSIIGGFEHVRTSGW